jgi:hypothetical protein
MVPHKEKCNSERIKMDETDIRTKILDAGF